MSLFSRRQELRLEDAIAELAAAQRVEPITMEDRVAAVNDALIGSDDIFRAGVIVSLLSEIQDSELRLWLLRYVQDATWGDVQ